MVLFFLSSAFAQNSGDLRGSIHDKSGKPGVSAFVIAQDSHSAVIRAASTNEAGQFEIASLPVGEYALEVTADGRAKLEVHDIQLNIGHVVNLDLVLGKGETKAAVEHAAQTSADVESANT